MFKGKLLILAWLLFTVALSSLLSWVFFYSEDKTPLLPGITSSGHHQIEQRCELCHTDEPKPGVFTTSGVTNKACMACHKEELELANDSHPAVKFRNPENFVFLEHIQADQCITCHVEHQQHRTGPMAVTVPEDYCAHCHQVTLETRESHKDLPFTTCTNAGCHNFHDNLALFENFLVTHGNEPDMLLKPWQVKETDAIKRILNGLDTSGKPVEPLAASDADAPEGSSEAYRTAHKDWAHTAHAKVGVNCSDCHGKGNKWVEKPDPVTSCTSCHETQHDDFVQGKHGMRLAAELSAMTPEHARLAMKPSAAHLQLSCVSCHDTHKFDRVSASVDSCMQCHDDQHTRSYTSSAHFNLWKAEKEGKAPAGTGVSCATCHMPREDREDAYGGGRATVVQHNQNANLRPNEKMIRSVCQNCHGLQFTMDSLADQALIEKNFNGRPEHGRAEGIRWALEAVLKRGDATPGEAKKQIEDPGPGAGTANDPEPSQLNEPQN